MSLTLRKSLKCQLVLQNTPNLTHSPFTIYTPSNTSAACGTRNIGSVNERDGAWFGRAIACGQL